jgi:predicted nucleic acid-binding protein
VIVLDASVVAPLLTEDEERWGHVRARVRSELLYAPELLDLEVISVWRRAARSGGLGKRRALQALSDLDDLALVRTPHRLLMPRIWELRDNLSAYDAAYVALAEALDAPLLTADERMARSPALRCAVELVG